MIALALTCILFSSVAPAADFDGRLLYLTRCASCHGHQGRGDGPDAEVFAEKPRDLRAGLLEEYSTDDLVRRIRASTALELALDPSALKERADEVDAVVTHLERLPGINWETTVRGWGVYTDRCEVCHGRYGAPTKDLPAGVRPPRDLSQPVFQSAIGDRELATAVRHGRKGMPVLVPRVDESAVKPLAAFVRLLSPGLALYSRYCATCHGDDGLGAHNPPGSLGMPEVTFDRRYFAPSDSERLHIAVWHMLANEKPAMPHFRSTITEPEARAIVDYLKRGLE